MVKFTNRIPGVCALLGIAAGFDEQAPQVWQVGRLRSSHYLGVTSSRITYHLEASNRDYETGTPSCDAR
jgi:hypothetical protein